MSQRSYTPSITLPSLPARVYSGTSFGRRTPQRISRASGLAPWDAFDEESSDMGHGDNGIALPIQLESDGVDFAGVAESTPRWRQNVAGWRRGVPGPEGVSPTTSAYTSVYPLSTTPSFSQSSFFDSESPLSGESELHSDGCSDTFGARASPDWAPWLSHSPTSTPQRSRVFEDTLSPFQSRTPGTRRPPILKTSTTFYLPPLYNEQQRPTFATPRRPPRPASSASISTTNTTSTKAREGCFAFCTSRNKTTPRDVDRRRPPVTTRSKPPVSARGKHYRISFVQDRQWRANILNQAVEESLTSALFPMPPKPSKSKYAPRSTPTHRTEGTPGTVAPSTSSSTRPMLPFPAAGRGHDPPLAGPSHRTTDATTTKTTDTNPEREEAEPEQEFGSRPTEPWPGAIETIDSTESDDERREAPELPVRDAPSPFVCPSLRHIYMFPEEAMERLARQPASPRSPTFPRSPTSLRSTAFPISNVS